MPTTNNQRSEGRNALLTRRAYLVGCAGAAAWHALSQNARALQPDSTHALLQVIDERRRSASDFRADVRIEQPQRGRPTIVCEAQLYRRSQDGRALLIVSAPEAARGPAYAWSSESFSFFEPSTGKWLRGRVSDFIGATRACCSDLEPTRYATDFRAQDGGRARVGAYSTQVVELRPLPRVNAAFARTTLWVDRETNNVLKKQEHGAAGELLRTSYYLRWRKLFSEAKRSEVWYPEDLRVYDEVDVGSATTLRISHVSLAPLDASLFHET